MEWALEPKTVSIQWPLGPRRYAPGLSPPCGPRQQQRLPHSLGQEGVVAGVARLCPQSIYVCQIFVQYNLPSIICQLYLNKPGIKKLLSGKKKKTV